MSKIYAISDGKKYCGEKIRKEIGNQGDRQSGSAIFKRLVKRGLTLRE